MRYTSSSSPRLLDLYAKVPVGSESGQASWQFKMALQVGGGCTSALLHCCAVIGPHCEAALHLVLPPLNPHHSSGRPMPQGHARPTPCCWPWPPVLQVLEYWSQGAAGGHHQYIQALPGIAPGVPQPGLAMFFTDEELQATQKQALATDAVSQRYWWRNFCETTLSSLPGTDADPFHGQMIDEQRLGWALAVATSRSFGIKQIGGHTMVPLVDMADHSFESNAEVRANDDSSISMIANKPVQAGQAVLLKYGSHDNHNLLLSYGFLLPGNPYEKFSMDFDVSFVLQVRGCWCAGMRPCTHLYDASR